MKRLLTAVILLVAASLCLAALSTYTFSQSASAYTELVSPTIIHDVAIDDAMSSPINIGFNFFFDGYSYPQFKANSNGFITLNPASTASLSNALATQTLIVAPLWDDLKTDDTNAGVSYLLTGIAPNRILKVQFKNEKWYYSASPVNLVNFQVWLYENTNVIEFYYGTMGTAPGTSASASCGLSGLVAGNYLSVTPATPTATVSSAAEFTAINGTHVPFMTGNKYVFTPPAPSAIPNVATNVSPTDTAINVFATATLNWADGGGWTNGFKVYFGTTTPPPYVGDFGYVTSYDPPGEMAYNTLHYWQIVPYNGQGDNTTGAIWSFTTAGAPLTGTKTIGTGGDYTTFTGAITALNTVGVGVGGVTFNVADETFSENPPAITASGSAANPIKFQALSGNPVVTPIGGALSFGFKMDGADYVTFDNIDINGPNTLIYGYWLANGAHHNTIKNCSITVPYGASVNYGIYSLGVSGNPNGYLTVQNNTIASSYSGIYLSGASGYEAQNLDVNNNTITGVRSYGIYVFYAQNSVINNNNIGLFAGGTTAYYGIYAGYVTTNSNIHHNTISGGYTTSTVYGIYSYYSACNYYYNAVSNLYNTSSSAWYGFYSYYPVNDSWDNNTINNITNTGTSSFYGIYSYYGSNTSWTNNTVSSISITTGTMYTSYMYYTTNTSFHDNVITGLNGNGSMYGYYVNGGTTHSSYRNKIYNLNYGGTSTGIVYGIYIIGGTTVSVYNNFVYDLRNTSGTTAPQIRGIAIAGGTTDNIYYNTVFLNATGTNTNFSTAALYVSAGTTIDLKNNIFVNNSTPGATGRTVALWKTTAGVTNFNAASNKNIYYAGAPDATHMIGYFNSVAYLTLAEYKTMVATIDQSSYTEDVPFISSTNLHINPAIQTRVEGNAIVIPSVTTDIDNETRNVSFPDIGADEGTFTPVSGPPSPAAIVAPTDAASDVAITQVLQWSAGGTGGTPTGYRVYWGNTNPPPFIQDQAGTTYSPTMLFGQTYYWKIIPFNIDGDAAGCPVWSYTTTNGQAITPNPSNGATMVLISSRTLGWAAVAGATSYTITIGTTPGASNIANAVACPANSYLHTSDWTYGQIYYWKVNTLYPGGPVIGTEWNFTAQPDPRITLPYTENFDGATPNLVISPAGSWVIGTPAKPTYVIGTHSGINSIVTTSLTGSYNINENSSVTVAINTAPLERNINVEFWQKFYTEAGWDGMELQYSIDNQGSWIKWDANLGTGVNFDTATSYFWYNSSSTSGPLAPPKWSGNNSGTLYQDDANGWLHTTTVIPYSLFSAAGNLSLRWHFMSDSSVSYEGFAVDDIYIWEEPPITIAPDPVTMVSPLDQATAVDPRTVILDWAPASTGGGVQYYTVYISDNISDPYGQYQFNVDAPTSLFSPITTGALLLDYETRWYWTVRPMNVIGGPALINCPTWYFDTETQISANVSSLDLGPRYPGSVYQGTIIVGNLGDNVLNFNATSSPEISIGYSRPSIPGTGTINLDYSFTAPLTLGAYSGFIQLSETSPGSAVINIPVVATIAEILQIGSGTVVNQSIPVEPYWTYTYSQSIYLQSDIGISGRQISGVSYYYNGYEAWSEPNIDIYMGHTTRIAFASTTDYEPLANLTLVFSGPYSVPATAGWINFTLPVPFAYNNVDNLIIAVNENGGPTTTYHDTNAEFFCTTVTGNRSLYYYNDSAGPYDPLNPTLTTGSSGTRTAIPNTILGLSSSSPEGPTITGFVNLGFINYLSWDSVDGATEYKIYKSTDPYAALPWTLEATILASNTSYNVPIVYNQEFYYVTAITGTREIRIPAMRLRK